MICLLGEVNWFCVWLQCDAVFNLALLYLQYNQFSRLSTGPITYAEDEDGNLLPLAICKEYYKKGSVNPTGEAFDIDAQLETGWRDRASPCTSRSDCGWCWNNVFFGVEVVPNNDKIKLEFNVLCRNMKWMFWPSVFVFSPVCMSHYPHNPLLHNSSFFDLDFYRYCCHHFNTLNVSLLSIDTIILPHELSQTCQHQNNFWAQRNQSADRSNTRVARLLLFPCHGTVSQLFS